MPMHPGRSIGAVTAIALAGATALGAQTADSARAAYTAAECPSCAEWNAPTPPVHLFGNAYWVGTRGLGSVLLTSSAGHVLIDGALPESAAEIMASIRALGFRVEDIKLIVNSHVHYDHAGGIAAIQRTSGAAVAASPASAPVLRTGRAGADDPQYGIALAFPPVAAAVRTIADEDTLRVGSIAIVAHFTPGHTPGGTSWSWRSCEGARCLDFVYADSQSPISADGFAFTHSAAYPTALGDFERSFALLERLSCDVIITPHPGASRLWERLDARDHGDAEALVDRDGCKRYAASARAALAKRVADESRR